jgi:hypothetical protein
LFRNAGLNRDGIYTALKKFAANRCEDGADYPDDKLEALADAIVELVPDCEPIFGPRPISREMAQKADELERQIKAEIKAEEGA